jgi:septum formation protein
MKYNEIILASASPRRNEMLKNTGLPFRVEESNFEEDMSLAMAPDELVEYLAREKAREVASRFPESLVIGGDTIVVFGNKRLGKPKDKEDAVLMLKEISGNAVEVLSGGALVHSASGSERVFHERTTVRMRTVSDETIQAYVETGIPMDRAGAFGIQDIGGRFIERIEGDYFTVLGLPLFKVFDALYEFDASLMNMHIRN